MATESEIPISELKADEAYLRFIACRSPDDRVYNLAYERLWELLYGRAKQHAWNKVGGKTKRNQKHENLVEDAVLQAFAKIVRQQHKDTYQRDPSKTIDGVWSHKGNSERKVAAFSSWFFGIVGNNVIDALRKTGRFPVPGSTFDIAGEEGEGGDFIEQVVDERTESASVRADEIEKEKAEDLRDCVDNLPEQNRLIVNMKYSEMKTLHEIAESLAWMSDQNKPLINRVHKILKAAENMLRECIGKKGHQ